MCYNILMHDSKFKDLTGKKFGEWTVIGKNCFKNACWYWNCKCSCGTKRVVYGTSLNRGISMGCGHNRKHFKTHGMSNTRPWRAYRNMLNRCNNPNVPEYKYYGGRGINVCKEWDTFAKFWNDMGSGYRDNLTIDRIDNNKGYCKDNCRWITQGEQNNNIRNNKILTYRGEKDTLPNWARRMNMTPNTLRSRIYLYGWEEEMAISTPPSNKNKRKSFRVKHPGYRTPLK